jgi:hypothetical protein
MCSGLRSAPACFCTCTGTAFCNNPVHAQVTQQTADIVIDYTRLENMSAVIHTHAVMCSYLPCSLFLCMYGTLYSAITLCMHSDDNRHACCRLYKAGSHSYTCCDATSGLPCGLFLYWHFVFCNNPVHAKVTTRQQTAVIDYTS